MMHKLLLIAAASLVVFGPLFAACQVTPKAQAELDRIETEKVEAKQETADTRIILEDTEARLQEIARALANRDQEISDAERAALQAEVDLLNERINGLTAQLAALASVEVNLDDQERMVKAQDRGEQAGGWFELAGAITGGGVLGKIFSGLGRSRAAEGLARLQSEMAALRAAAETYQNTPSRAAGAVGVLGEKLARMEGIMEAFTKGLSAPVSPGAVVLANDPSAPPAPA